MSNDEMKDIVNDEEVLLDEPSEFQEFENHQEKTNTLTNNNNESITSQITKYSPIFQLFNSICLILQFFCLLLIIIIIIIIFLIFLSSSNPSSIHPQEQQEQKNNEEKCSSSLYDLTESIADTLGVPSSSSPPQKLPTLILQITIDQFRADLLFKYRKRFIKNGGFDRLLKNGVVYRNAHYRQGRTVTPVGHSTIYTGGVPYSHGIVAHKFLDFDSKTIIGSTYDPKYQETNGIEELKEMAPTQLLSTTIGDELRLFSESSKVFSVSSKSYPSILQAGHSGKAFWWSLQTGNYISSTYFFNTSYPTYVDTWNSKELSESYKSKVWKLSYPLEEYHYNDEKNREFCNPIEHQGKVFPKPLFTENKNISENEFLFGLLQTPFGDQIMWDFTKNLIKNEKLGKNEKIIDFLGLSFSSLDKVGHYNGPDSIESEDIVWDGKD